MRCACFDLSYREKDITFWLYDNVHPCFKEWPHVYANRFMDEIELMTESGLTDSDYYALERGARAARVAAMICRRAVASMRQWDTDKSK